MAVSLLPEIPEGGKDEKEEKDWTEYLYQESLPEEIVKELTPKVRRQYFLWDEVMKREIELYPWLILPVVKEIFNREYPEGRDIVLLSTEYTVSRIHEKGEKLLHAIRSDLLLRIERDMYHFECQIGKSGEMVFRMLEYDIHIGLTHGKEIRKSKNGTQEFAVFFPKSAVLYLGDERNIPLYENCTMYFQDGTEHIYRIPVMKVQEYSLEEIEERHLNILIPFLPVRFWKQISKVSEKKVKADEAYRENVKKNLTKFLLGCKEILNREREREVLSENARKDIWEFIWKICSYLMEKDAKLYEEVSEEVEPAIKLSREIIEDLKDDIRELRNNNKKLMDSKNVLLQELENACEKTIGEAAEDGRSTEETVNMLMRVFSLTKEEAEAKVKKYRKE